MTTTQRAADWRDTAACRTEDRELFFPKGADKRWQDAIEQAKAVCRRCPSVEACLQFALTNGIDSGIFGGLTELERAGLRRSTKRHNLPPEKVAARAEQARTPQKPRTLQTIFDDNTTRLHNGHVVWTGPKKVHLGGQIYTPKQVAFITDRGHHPDGQVTSDCGVTSCVLPLHLIDVGERTRCSASVRSAAA